MRVGSLFSGQGQLDFGLMLAGDFEHAWFCESDPWRRDILAKRWPGVPIFEDIREFRADNAGPVDVVAGGFPCKGISGAGKEEGFGHPETVLWREMRRIVGEVRPRYVVVENVARILGLSRGELWGEILGDLAEERFDVVWDCLPAAAFGAPHRRDRIIAVAVDSECRRHPAELPAGVTDEEASEAKRHGEASSDPVGPQQKRHGGELGEQGGRADARGDGEVVANPERESSELRRGPGPVPRQTRAIEGAASEWQRDRAAARGSSEVAPDSPRDAQGQPEAPAGSKRERAGSSASIGIEWGEYGPAIERYERIHGLAPEPLIRRVDDGTSRRVVRSRLSALGDGVQVELGIAAGRCILDYEREAVAA